MTKRSLGDKLDGFELRGRTRRHLYLCGEKILFRNVPLILIYKQGREIRIGSWAFSIPYGLIYLKDRGRWLNEYVPLSGLENKRVLDIGAGCGESAKFFLDNGASRVVAVENNVGARIYLKSNALRNKGLIVSNRPTFDPYYHLKDPESFDLVKCDIEGYEIHLAEYLERNPPLNKDIILEVHSVYMRDRFYQLGFNEIPTRDGDPPQGFPTRIMFRWALS